MLSIYVIFYQEIKIILQSIFWDGGSVCCVSALVIGKYCWEIYILQWLILAGLLSFHI